MKFGQNIKQIRKRMNITQSELATKMGISQSYLSDIENGRKNPSIKTVKKLADSLGLSVTDLFNDNTTF
ncbi:transcriptional regulator with XRE-family HTH domain [Staphylococcus simulans]|uniref:helix-turn-helix domain-containing protein n=1 Tax=Staphylococcus simulans TaxID=1286 RepID=UPI0030C55DC2